MDPIRVISIWQPYATLWVAGFKMNETRPFPCHSLVGKRLYVASTSTIKPQQRALFNDERFQHYYAATGLPPLEELPHGYLLGSVLINSCDPIGEDDLDDITEEEQLYGDWRPGRYAWRGRDPQFLPEPIKVSGAQGIWFLKDAAQVLDFNRTAQKG